MKIKVWVVSTCIPEPGATTPCLPSVFGTEAEAEAHADASLRAEWKSHADWNDDGTEQKPYPGDWREACAILAAENGEGSWGEWQITSHEIEIGGIAGMIVAAPAATGDAGYLSRFPEAARHYCDRAYQDGYEDGRNDSDALLDLIREEAAKDNAPLGRSDSLALDNIRRAIRAADAEEAR